jgi:hypothetical protein
VLPEHREPDAFDTVVCTNCGRQPHDDQDWLWWQVRSGGLDELNLFCGDCDETELSPGSSA